MKTFKYRLKVISLVMVASLLMGQSGCKTRKKSGLFFSITYSEALSKVPLTGRMLLLLSNNNKKEPRYLVGDGPDSQLVFGKPL